MRMVNLLETEYSPQDGQSPSISSNSFCLKLEMSPPAGVKAELHLEGEVLLVCLLPPPLYFGGAWIPGFDRFPLLARLPQ